MAPGVTYWVILENPAGQSSTFWWINGVTPTITSGFAQFVVDTNGARWLSYPTDFWRPSAMRVVGRVEK